MLTPSVAVVLHDVAPTRWAECLRVLAQVQALARDAGVVVPVSLLVVPEYHGAPSTPPFLRWLRQQAREGHELVLHGWTHRDDSAGRGGIVDHAMRRWYTAGEGEFAALDRIEADRRLAHGRAWAAAHRLPLQGFVAPAWLLSDAALDAVADAGFRYTCTLAEVMALPARRALAARSIVFSTRSAWRRMASLGWNHALGRVLRQAPLLRIELHPQDADFPAIRRCWSTLLARALRDGREPLRLADVVARLPTDDAAPAGVATA